MTAPSRGPTFHRHRAEAEAYASIAEAHSRVMEGLAHELRALGMSDDDARAAEEASRLSREVAEAFRGWPSRSLN